MRMILCSALFACAGSIIVGMTYVLIKALKSLRKAKDGIIPLDGAIHVIIIYSAMLFISTVLIYIAFHFLSADFVRR